MELLQIDPYCFAGTFFDNDKVGEKLRQVFQGRPCFIATKKPTSSEGSQLI